MYLTETTLRVLNAQDLISWQDDNDFEHIMQEEINKAGCVPYSIGKLTAMAFEMLENKGYVRNITDDSGMQHLAVERIHFIAAACFIAKKARQSYLDECSKFLENES